MAIPYRGQIGFNTYFITFNVWQKRRLLQSYLSAELFIEVLYQFRTAGRYLVHEFVVMPNHFHALLTPLRPTALERCVGLVKGASHIGMLASGDIQEKFGKPASWIDGSAIFRNIRPFEPTFTRTQSRRF
jgi:REP element-mobilizing transposase RayT